jgi:hypothetical protein
MSTKPMSKKPISKKHLPNPHPLLPPIRDPCTILKSPNLKSRIPFPIPHSPFPNPHSPNPSKSPTPSNPPAPCHSGSPTPNPASMNPNIPRPKITTHRPQRPKPIKQNNLQHQFLNNLPPTPMVQKLLPIPYDKVQPRSRAADQTKMLTRQPGGTRKKPRRHHKESNKQWPS